MSQNNWTSIWHALNATGDLSGRSVFGADATLALGDLVEGSSIYGRGDELDGRSVLIAASDQFTAASALIELDGVARRIVLCPPDLAPEHLPYVIEAAEVDTIVSDRPMLELGGNRRMLFCPCTRKLVPGNYDRTPQYRTEWILLTSGTTGPPKLVVHTLASLAGAIQDGGASADPVVWSTFYDIRRYGGLQIFLRAALTGTSLVLSSARESAAEFLARAGSHGVTHISGTPSHWRQALMSPAAHRIAPRYVRLSGEIADQSILNHLQSFYPQAGVSHAFASTEAGVAFDVTDGMEGFPVAVLDRTPGVEMKVEDCSLHIRSARTACSYLGAQTPVLKAADGFVDTGDMIELRDGRCYFVGRRDGVINVGGLKVHPEEVEAVINRHPEVRMSLVHRKKSPVTGALVVAEVVLNDVPPAGGRDVPALQRDIQSHCRNTLSPHKVPVAINFVPALAVAESGKMVRADA